MLNPRWPGSTPSCPPGAKVLLVGQAAVFHLNHPIVYNTVFNHEIIETLARGRTPEEVRRELHAAGRHPRLRRLVRDRPLSARRATTGSPPSSRPSVSPAWSAGVLEPARPSTRQELYQVR